MTNTHITPDDGPQHGHENCPERERGYRHGGRGHHHDRNNGERDFGPGAGFAGFATGRGFGPGADFGPGMPFGPGFRMRRHGFGGFGGFGRTAPKKSEIRILKQLRRLVRTLIVNRDTATKEQRQQLLALLENTTADAQRILTGTKAEASATEE